jgi:hypothetical protein
VGPVSPLVVTRNLPDTFLAGQTMEVSLDIEVNAPSLTDLEVHERLPFEWHASRPSPSGSVETDATGRDTVVWKLSGNVQSQTLTYDLAIPAPFANVRFTGGLVIAGGKEYPIFGDEEVSGRSDPNPREALVIVMKQPVASGCAAPACCAGSNPGLAAQARDYLTDGDEVTEESVVPAAGASVSPDFAAASPSPGPTTAGDLTWIAKAAARGGTGRRAALERGNGAATSPTGEG